MNNLELHRNLMEQTATIHSRSVVEQLLAEERGHDECQLLIDVNKKLMSALRLQAQYVIRLEQEEQQ